MYDFSPVYASAGIDNEMETEVLELLESTKNGFYRAH